MESAYLGRSNLVVSKICLGTMHFGSKTGEKEAFEVMDKALDLGINFFDTSNNYGAKSGQAEEIIGKWFKQGGGRREKVVLATKVYWIMEGNKRVLNDEPGISAYKVRRHLEDSLRRLQTDHIDLYQVHHFDRRVTGEEFWGSLERVVERGDITYVGTSNFPGWGLAKFQMIARQRGTLGIVSEQCMYNLFNRMPELEVIPAACDFGIGILAYMPLAGGLLAGNREVVAGSRTDTVKREYGIEARGNQQIADFSKLCQELGEKENIVAIAWTLANPGLSSSIVGIRTPQHLDGLQKASELKLDQAVMQRLGEIFNINRGKPLQPGAAPEAFAW
jgi:aryl-alcohol dehydrogenase-like predicted oxidoreductase